MEDATVLGLMNEDASGYKKIKQAIEHKPSTMIEVNKLNELFDCMWCWAIIDTGYNEETMEYSIAGRLYLPGLGFRDGVGSGNAVDAADRAALSNAFAKIGIAI